MKTNNQRLLISIRGPVEAIQAAKGGAHIADVEYPASALGTPYPLNISAVSKRLKRHKFEQVLISTNIGEVQAVRASACQAALGVAVAGADLIKFGLAEQSLESAAYLADSIIRTVKKFAPGKCFYPAIFVDEDMARFLKPFAEGPELVQSVKADGLLIDTFNKQIGKSLLDYCHVDEIAELVIALHAMKKEAWIAGSVTLEDLPALWQTGVDVICVRGAACAPDKGGGRFGKVSADIIRKLVQTIPDGHS